MGNHCAQLSGAAAAEAIPLSIASLLDMPATVLVTGASGNIATSLCKALLDAGYVVRGTVRNPANGKHLEALCPGLQLFSADLESDGGWDAACAGCDYVLHVASPFVLSPTTRDSLVRPAVEGTKRVLGAALRAKVRRVVLTSSCSACSEGHKGTGKGAEGYVYTEADWTNSDNASWYSTSKTEAERAAWALVKNSALELVAINPSFVHGPMLSSRDCTSFTLMWKLVNAETQVPMVPNAAFYIADMRDVVATHLAAMKKPNAAGQRYLVHSGSCHMTDIARSLAADFPEYSVPTRSMPAPLQWFLGLFMADIATLPSSQLKLYDTSKAERELGVKMHSWQEAVKETARTLIELGLLKPKLKK